MATVTEVKRGLDDITQIIVTERRSIATAKSRIVTASDVLGALPTQFSDVISEINGYTPTGPFEEQAQDERAKIATEFTALKGEIDALILEF